VLAKDTPGFIVNRVARPYYGEALRILEEGIADAATVDWAMRDLGGLSDGPLRTDGFHRQRHQLHRHRHRNGIPIVLLRPPLQALFYPKNASWMPTISAAKPAAGFYNYREGAVQPEPQRDEHLGRQVLTRILCMLINEAADALYLHIANRNDIDLAMTQGVNYPKGLLAWADELGIDNIVHQLDWLHAEYCDDRYRCCRLLRIMAREKRTFY
jgi:3-hydroxybutyryl-CoA dehydrogenase